MQHLWSISYLKVSIIERCDNGRGDRPEFQFGDGDVLVGIFRHLDRPSLICVAGTCKVLRALAYSPFLWKDCIVRQSTAELSKSVAESYNMRRIETVIIHLDTAVVDLWRNVFVRRNLERLALTAGIKTLSINHLPHDDVLRSSPTSYFPSDFQCSRCLVLKEIVKEQDFMTFDYLHLFEAAFKALVNLKQLQFEFIVLPTYGCSGTLPSAALIKRFSSFNYFQLICKHLPKLEDLQLYEEYESRRDLRLVPPTGKQLSGEETIWPDMDRFSISQAMLAHHLESMQLPNIFPKLRHLEIERNKCQNSISESYMKGIISQMEHLESLCLSMECTVISMVFPELHRLKALYLSPETSYSNFDTILESCPNLEVFFIEGYARTTDHLCAVLKKLPKLKILQIIDLGMNSFDEKFFDQLRVCGTNLMSLIGLECSDLSVLPAHIKFITCKADKETYTHSHRVDLLMRSSSGWVNIQRNSATWHCAMGTWYFRPKGSFLHSFT